MAKHLSPKPDSHILQGLPLCLVDCGGKGDPDWELSSLPLKWIVTCLRDERDAGNKDNSIRSNNPALEQLAIYGFVIDQLCSITQALSWVYVSQKHQGNAGLQIEDVLGKSIGLEGIEVLRVESECIVRILKCVSTTQLGDVARYPVLHHLIDSRNLRCPRMPKNTKDAKDAQG